MTKIDDPHVRDRITTHDDERKRVLDLFNMRLVPPDVGIFDSPTRCYPINKQWAKIVMGMVSWLTEVSAWQDAQNEGFDGCEQVAKFLEGDNCIDAILSDDVFFNEQYIPATFGDWYTNTTQHNEDLNDAYDGTPQSIGAEIPAGAPNEKETYALCYALNSFVSLYASTKVCILQSRNFLEIAWDEVREAVNAVYNLTVQSLAFIYTPDLYSCFVTDDEAISVLQDEAALEELACFLLEELSSVAMTQSNFDDAISAAVTTLTGNAQLIACIFENDNNLTVYLNFLEAYNIALLRINAGEELECPCLTGDYVVYTHDFATGLMGNWEFFYFGSQEMGVLESNRIRGIPIGDQKIIEIVWTGTLPTWRIRAVKIYTERIDGIANGTDDTSTFSIRPNPNSVTGQQNAIQGGFRPNGNDDRCGFINIAPFYWTNAKQLAARATVTNNATSAIYLHKIEIQFYSGFSPAGYVTDDNNICI